MSPAVCGLFRPVILLPQSLVEKLSAGQLRAVLLHETIHLRRGDVWVNCAQALLQIVYWWHPLLWLANARIRRVREEAVDDAVMLALRDDAEIYAPTLLEVAKLAFNRPLASLGLVGILESRSALRQRIERLVNFNAPKKAGLTVVSILGILAFSAVALPMGEAPEKTNAPSDTALAGNGASPAKLEIFRIYRSPKANDLNKLLLKAGVKIPPTVLVPENNGIVLARGSEDQLALVRQVVLELNGFAPNDRNAIGEPFMTFVMGNASPVSTNLERRVFKPDPHAFLFGLQGIRGLQTNNVETMVESLLNKLGVDLTAPGRSIAFNDKLGLLFVTATASELDTIERAVQALNFWEPQIHIKARFIEVPKDGFVMPTTLSNNIAGQMVGILNDPEFRTVLQALEHRQGAEILAEPEAVTISGRQTQMRATSTEIILTNFTFQETSSNSAVFPQNAKYEIGPAMDFVPWVLSDGYTIDLTTIVSESKFIGYDQVTNDVFATNSIGKVFHVPIVSPSFRVQQGKAVVNLWDNQTLVLGNLTNLTNKFVGFSGGRAITAESQFLKDLEKKQGTTDKELLVFITATIVDPAGNRVHSDDEMRQIQERTKSYAPPQPQISTPSP